MISLEDEKDDTLAATFDLHRDGLGEQAVKAALESVKLRGIVRRSVIPYRETWPEESWHQIGALMTSPDLCNAGILECMATRRGSRANALELAKLEFDRALEAYDTAGYYGQKSTKMEDAQ